MKTKMIILGAIATFSILLGSFIRVTSNWASYSASKSDNSTPNRVEIEEKQSEENETLNVVIDDNTTESLEDDIDNESLTDTIIEEQAIPERNEVYDGLTIEELSEKINRSLNSDITGKGYLIASHSLELGVDPYMATAIILQETGCKWQCSYLVKSCNNVGGQKGSGCGSYSYFNSLDEGIIAFIDNLYKNYISYGLYTPEQINPKYAEDPNWAVAVNKYIESIKVQ